MVEEPLSVFLFFEKNEGVQQEQFDALLEMVEQRNQRVGGKIKDGMELLEKLERGEESIKGMEEKRKVELLHVEWMNVEGICEVTVQVVV